MQTTERRLRSRRAFSLIELVIVVVILGIIGAIAIPRMSRGSAGAAESALVSDLATLRGAIDLYAAEHNGTYPTLADFSNQLLTYTDVSGNTNATKTTTFAYGPYLRSIPPLPVKSARQGQNGVGNADGATIGWIYDETAGTIKANTSTGEGNGTADWNTF